MRRKREKLEAFLCRAGKILVCELKMPLIQARQLVRQWFQPERVFIRVQMSCSTQKCLEFFFPFSSHTLTLSSRAPASSLSFLQNKDSP